MIKINCNNKLKDRISKKKLEKVTKIFLKYLFKKELEISLYITDDAEIQILNKKYRNKNRPTDILSWTYLENDLEIFKNKNSLLAGEIVISADRVREQSKVNGWSFSIELTRLIAHGCAHIAGLDHNNSKKEERQMLEIEIKLLELIGINDIY